MSKLIGSSTILPTRLERGARMTQAKQQTIFEQLTPLTPIDLRSCKTVSDIVAGMASCSFGARMLGEVAKTVTEWARAGEKPTLVWDGDKHDKLYWKLHRMRQGENGGYGFLRVLSSAELVEKRKVIERAVIVGPYSEEHARELYRLIKRPIFVNAQGQCKPGLVKDGYFPDVVFADPELVMPILHRVFRERCSGIRSTVAELMQELENAEGVAKEVAYGAQTLSAMLKDPSCTVMFTVSGAMTIAKMQGLIVDLIETKRISYIAATGALMAHGLIEGSGRRHYKYDPGFPDQALADEGLNRVTDTIEPEGNFDHIEEIVTSVLNRLGRETPEPTIVSSHVFHRELGRYLVEHHSGERAILASAFRHDVPVVTPAFVDSEIANDVFVNNARRDFRGVGPIIFNQEGDTQVLFDLAISAERLGIFTVGGGVPRNNTQNVAPLIEIYNARLGTKLPPGRFRYGCRIDPASMALGHLSGCTYSEGGSWRKFDLDGMLAEVRCDATIAWPFMQRFALEQLGFYA